MATEWTNMVRDVLRNKGKQFGYEKQLIEERKAMTKGLNVQPDVLWIKNNKIKVIFEIDTFSRGDYQKTIFGSMLSGIVFAEIKNAKFVELVPKGDPSSQKAKLIAKLFKKYFHRTIYVIEVPRNQRYRHIHYNLTKELELNHIIPKSRRIEI
jgi:hypothetical protein